MTDNPPPPPSDLPPPPWSEPLPAPEPEDDDKRRKALLWMGAGALVVIALIVGVLAFGSDGASGFEGADTTDDDPSYEKADEVGINPFASPDDLIDELGVSFPSEAPFGLYGGTLSNTCDPERLADYLEANPSKAEAWAKVQGIAVGDIRDYLAELTPTVLTADTVVINHGYQGGTAKPIQATLQKGTAVLVDDDGVPRARCYCGNPLLPTDEPADEPAPSSSVECLAIASPLWLGFPGAPATPGSGSPISVPRPWKVKPGATKDVGGTTYVALDVDFTGGWLYSVGEGDYSEVWTTASSLEPDAQEGTCASDSVCYGGSGDVLPDLEGSDSLIYPANTTMTLTGATLSVGPTVWKQVEIVTGEVEPEYTFAWVQDGTVTAGACAGASATTTTAPPTTAAPTTTPVPAGCTAGSFDAGGKTVVFTATGNFDGAGGADTVYVYTQGGTTFAQFEIAGGTLSAPVDLGTNFDGGARAINGGAVINPVGSSVDVAVLEDRSTAGGAGNTGSSLVVSLVGCNAKHVTLDGQPTDIVSSATAASPTGLTCESGATGATSLFVFQGKVNAAGTDLDFDAVEYGYNPSNGSLTQLGFATTTGAPPGSPCY